MAFAGVWRAPSLLPRGPAVPSAASAQALLQPPCLLKGPVPRRGLAGPALTWDVGDGASLQLLVCQAPE